ncbi:family 78 glycoside hydrolase catalytic domain [Propionibacteriaceae bacterium Y2011]
MTGRWITAPGVDPQHPLLRTTFEVPDVPVTARLVVTGLGAFHAHLNGSPVSDAELEPGQTNFSRSALLCSYDVTDQVVAGRNVLGIEVGRGFYAMASENVWRWHEAPWRDSVRALAELHLELADGTGRVIASSGDWRAIEGPITRDSMYGGEDYDCRRDPVGWTTADFDDHAWTPAIEVRFGDGAPELRPQLHEPVRVVERLTPTWHESAPGRWRADFGGVVAGWVCYHWGGSGEVEFTAAHGEKLHPNGRVHHESPHISGPFQVDTVRLDEQHRDFRPRFSYKGFRYVEITGTDPAVMITPEDLELTAERITNDVASNAEFDCSDPYLTRFHEVMVRTLANNLVHIPTDTPTYEKNGWTGDAQTAIPAILTSFDAEHLLVKWLDDLRDSQLPDGLLPVIAPSSGWGVEPMWLAPEWTTVYAYLLTELIMEYGRIDLLEAHLAPALASLDRHLADRDADGLVGSELGDYLSPGPSTRAPEDRRLTASLFLATALRSSALACRLADRQDEATRRETEAEALIAAVNATFLTDDGYRTSETEYRQTSNILPLALGIVPAEATRQVVDSLVADIVARGDHHHVGHIGARHIMQALSDHGQAELALRVLRNDTPPGWKPWLDQGHSTWMEMWAEPRSYSHYFMGTPAIWLYEDLAGLRRGPEGWQSFIVRPRLDTDVTWVRFRRGTRHGVIMINWDTDRGTLLLTVPASSTATVDLGHGGIAYGPGEHEIPLV